MRHFVIYLVVIGACLMGAVFLKIGRENKLQSRPLVRIYAPSSFISQWGPGPGLKEIFERTCNCELVFLDSADINLLLQRLKMDGAGADLVMGLDQYDLERAQSSLEWNKLELGPLIFEEQVQSAAIRGQFVAYDWGVMTFVLRKSEVQQMPTKLDDFLKDEFRGKISLQDPRTSTPGLQFLLWLIQSKGEEEAFQYLQKLNPQLIGYSPSWSTAYGLFQKGQAKTVFSYVTSPVYHLVEDKSTDVIAVEMKEQHPIQIEYLGQPTRCRNCDLGEDFAKLMLSPEGQKIVMSKNYMFPVIKKVKIETPFESVPEFQVLDANDIPSIGERERILKRWSEFRRIN